MGQLLSTVKSKIVLGFVISTMVVLAVGGFGLNGIKALSDSLHVVYTGNVVPLSEVPAINTSLTQIRLSNLRMLLKKDKSKIQTIRSLEASIMETWKHYYANGISAPDELVIAEKMKPLLPLFIAAEDKVLDALDQSDFDMAAQRIEEMQPLIDNLADLTQQNVQSNVRQALESDQAGERQVSRLTWISVTLVVIGTLLSTAVAVFVMRAITHPLNFAVSVADDIAQGRLDRQITVDVKGELGKLLEALHAMQRQLASTVHSIHDSSESVTTAASQIAAGNLDLSTRTEEQASSLEQTAASVTELTETVRQNAENARQANSLASNAREMTGAGSAAVEAMVETINEISANSSKIADITGLIEGIAFQTNILALNAAVEAARAGEQGRGFAVVAGEVRSLAQRASGAAKEIKDLIDASSEKVRRGARQASEVNADMAKVGHAIEQVSNIVGEISAASDEQSKGIEQVRQAITQIDEVTQQNAALVEQSAAAAQSMQEQADKMKKDVMFFTLEVGAVSSSH